MKTTMLCVTGICLFLFAFGSLNRLYSADPDAPYIYYYSPSKQAFIIERADGQDSRVLTSYKLPEHTLLEGPGWSKGEQWFAWTAKAYVGASIPTNVYIVSNQGGNLRQVFTDEVYVNSMAWSPTNDLLMISYYPSAESVDEQVTIYDPVQNIFVGSISTGLVDAEPHVDKFYFPRSVWSPDGQRLALQYFDKLVIFELTGQYRIFDAQLDNTDSCNDFGFGFLPHWFKDGRIAYLRPDTTALTIDDLSSSEATIISLAGIAGVIVSTDWSPDENYALIYVKITASRTPKQELWLLSIPDKSIEQLSANVRFVNTCNIPFDKTAWNYSGQAWFIDDTGALWLVNASPLQFSKVEQLSEGTIPILAPLEWSEGGEVRFVWSNTKTYSTKIYTYDPQADTRSVLAPPENTPSTQITYFLSLNPDSLIYVDTGTAILIEKNKAQYTSIIFQPLPGFGQVVIGKIEKDASGKYLFLLDDSSSVSNLINVASSNGEMQRQISDCPLFDSASCFGWLPKTDFNDPN